jgi:hypothetical protein
MAVSIPIVMYLAAPVSLPGMPDVPDDNSRINYFFGHYQSWFQDNARIIMGDTARYAVIEDMKELRKGKWAGSFDTPELVPFDVELSNGTETPAMLMLHIFSTPSEGGRQRRQFLREYHPHLSVPVEYRHLVEVKFILGKYHISEEADNEEVARIEREEAAIEEEQRINGDVVRLDGLQDGENMNQGKTLAWIRWVGREGGREAQWVL